MALNVCASVCACRRHRDMVLRKCRKGPAQPDRTQRIHVFMYWQRIRVLLKYVNGAMLLMNGLLLRPEVIK